MLTSEINPAAACRRAAHPAWALWSWISPNSFRSWGWWWPLG